MQSHLWRPCEKPFFVTWFEPQKKKQILPISKKYCCSPAFARVTAYFGYPNDTLAENLDEFAQGCSDIWMFDGKKYCVGLISKDTILSYYECGIKGIFFKEEQNIKDSLWGDQLAENIIYSPDIVRYMNSFLWLETGLIGRHLIRIDYKNGKLVYIRKYL